MDDEQYGLVKVKLLDLIGIDLNFYKEAQMRRRLDSYLANHGGDLARFFQEAAKDPAKKEDLKDFITINVSEFYRDPDHWVEFQKTVMSQYKRGTPMQVWSAGCSIGAEAYTLAILFTEAGLTPQIQATDIDRAVLNRAVAGGPYPPATLRSVPPLIRKKYFVQKDDGEYVIPEIRAMVQFRQHDLLKDPYGRNFHLILCRNVIIYFTDAAKQEIFKRFHKALRPDGALFIGATEAILAANTLGLRRVSACIYELGPVTQPAAPTPAKAV